MDAHVQTQFEETLDKAVDSLILAADQLQKALDAAQEAGLVPTVKAYYAADQKYKLLDTARKKIYALLDAVDKGVLPKLFDDNDLDLVRVPELARSFYPTTKYSAKTIDKEKLMDWLRQEGQEELISETVNSSTLAGFLKDRMLSEGIDPPSDIVELTTYKTIGSSKYTPK